MYWTHLIFALILGLLLHHESITAVKPGYLDFDNLPETNFSCKNKVIGGYYADVETGCQMFHVCTIGQKGEVTDIKFLCLNGTVFDQETRVCERIDEVDCSKSEDFFNLNLELYGNQAGGIQAEEEFFCEDCSTEEDDYDLSAEVTTRTTTSTTTTTTTTTRPTTTTAATTTTSPTPKVIQHYPTSSPETIAALLALHNAFTQSVQNPKVKPPPPRVINNAFASLAPSTPKPTYYARPQVTQLPPREDTYDDEEADSQQQNYRQQNRVQDHRVHQDHRIADHYSHHGHGTLSPSHIRDRHKSNFYASTTPANLKNNYHHFQSGDTGFIHSFDTGKQYNYHYFNPRRTPEPTAKASVSIVTSTSTSTSVRASKQNATHLEVSGPGEDFPTGYDDYPDDSVDEAFFRDVPKIRSKRSDKKPQPRHANHRYPDEVLETTTARHPNHRYEGATINPTVEVIAAGVGPEEQAPTQREEFLQNLLGSLDMDEHDRQRVARFFKVEEKEMDESAGLLHQLGNKLGELIMDDINKTIHQAKLEEKNSSLEAADLNKINEMWQHHYQEMSQEVDLKFDLGSDRGRRDAEKKEKLMQELAQDYELAKVKIEAAQGSLNITEKSRTKRQVKGLDTEKFRADYEPRKRTRPRPIERPLATATKNTAGTTKDVVPVFEEVDEGDFTTRPYLRPTLKPRLTTRAVDSTTRLRFNYEITTPAAPASFRRRNQGRSLVSANQERSTLVAEPKLLAAPKLVAVPNITRDVSKLKDVPVYEEEYDSGEVVIAPQVKQDFSVNQNDGLKGQNPGFIQFANGQIAFKVSAPVSTAGSFGFQPPVESVTPEEAIIPSSQAESEPTERPTRPPGRSRRPLRRRLEGRVDNQPRSSQRSESLLDGPPDGHTRVTIRSRARQQDEVRVSPESRRALGGLQRSEGRHQEPHTRARLRPRQRLQDPSDKTTPSSEILDIPERTASNQDIPPTLARLHGDQEVTVPTVDDQRPPESKAETLEGSQRSEGSQHDRIHTHTQARLGTRGHQQLSSGANERPSGGRGPGPRDHVAPDEADPVEQHRRRVMSRGKVRGTLRSTTPPNEPPPAPPIDPSLVPDPTFSCEGKIKGSFYADLSNDCKGFFICSQGQIDGPLLKSHFWCGTNTKFNQRSRTCQAEDLVECSVSERYYHLNQDFAIPETEEQLKPTFEPQRTRG